MKISYIRDAHLAVTRYTSRSNEQRSRSDEIEDTSLWQRDRTGFRSSKTE